MPPAQVTGFRALAVQEQLVQGVRRPDVGDFVRDRAIGGRHLAPPGQELGSPVGRIPEHDPARGALLDAGRGLLEGESLVLNDA
jgi:hypothetical protein